MIRDPAGGFEAIVGTEGTLNLTLLVGVAGAGILVADHIRTPYDDLFDRIGPEEGAAPDLLRALARQESGFRADVVSAPNRNGTRDYGLMQINETTARALGVDPQSLVTGAGRVERSIRTAARLLRQLRTELGSKLNTYTLIAAYNAGAPAIRARGIFNMPYTSSVAYHWQLYTLGSLLRTSGGTA